MSRSDSRIAEQLYQRALKLAGTTYGDHAADVGLVLLDFVDFLHGQGRAEEAGKYNEQIRLVLARCLDEQSPPS